MKTKKRGKGERRKTEQKDEDTERAEKKRLKNDRITTGKKTGNETPNRFKG